VLRQSSQTACQADGFVSEIAGGSLLGETWTGPNPVMLRGGSQCFSSARVEHVKFRG